MKYPRFGMRSAGRLAALLWALSSVGGAFAEEEAPAAEAAATPTAEESASDSAGGAFAEEEAPAAEAAAPPTAEESASEEGNWGRPPRERRRSLVTGERQSIDRAGDPRLHHRLHGRGAPGVPGRRTLPTFRRSRPIWRSRPSSPRRAPRSSFAAWDSRTTTPTRREPSRSTTTASPSIRPPDSSSASSTCRA